MKIAAYEVRPDEKPVIERLCKQYDIELVSTPANLDKTTASMAAGCDGVTALGLERLDNIVEAVGIGGDLKDGAVGLDVLGAGVERVHHDGLLVELLVLVVDDDHALAVEGPADAALCAHALAELIEIVADLGGGALAVVGQRLDDDGRTAGAVALVGDGLVVVGVARAERLLDGALDVVVGHIGGLGLGHDGRETGVIRGVAAAALLHGDNDLLGDLGEGGGALGIGRTLGFLDIVPLGMSGHSIFSP